MLFNPRIPADQPKLNWVESPWLRQPRMARWLMGSRTWYRQILKPSCTAFAQLLKQPVPAQAAVLDAGCGEGLAFKLIERYFQPRIIFGLEIDKDCIANAISRAGRLKTPTHVMQGDVALASFKDETFDIIFAHHLVQYSEDQTALVHKMVAL
ncbi:MAG TPA: class I SAM-dependent methyltransferase, partial [Marinagarivorans sp.]|nr:class I SAM-dependent methyltransferase [Marinagarivorans sp.]